MTLRLGKYSDEPMSVPPVGDFARFLSNGRPLPLITETGNSQFSVPLRSLANDLRPTNWKPRPASFDAKSQQAEDAQKVARPTIREGVGQAGGALRSRSSEKRRRYHEAGHAVVGIWKRGYLGLHRPRPRPGTLGHVVGGRWARSIDPEFDGHVARSVQAPCRLTVTLTRCTR